MSDDLSIDIVLGVSGSIREVDFVGWFRSQVVIGAVLTDYVSSGALTLHALRQKIETAVARSARGLGEPPRVHVRLIESGRKS